MGKFQEPGVRFTPENIKLRADADLRGSFPEGGSTSAGLSDYDSSDPSGLSNSPSISHLTVVPADKTATDPAITRDEVSRLEITLLTRPARMRFETIASRLPLAATIDSDRAAPLPLEVQDAIQSITDRGGSVQLEFDDPLMFRRYAEDLYSLGLNNSRLRYSATGELVDDIESSWNRFHADKGKMSADEIALLVWSPHPLEPPISETPILELDSADLENSATAQRFGLRPGVVWRGPPVILK